jgi:subtilisin-like proprotein convertase family protein
MLPLPLRSMFVVLVIAAAVQAQPQSEMRLDRVRQSLSGTHRHYTQYIDGVRVIGGERSETLLPAGAVRVNFDREARAPKSDGPRAAALEANGAPALSRSSVCGSSPAESRCSVDAELVYVNVGGVARAAVRAVILTRPLEPHARYVDLETGALLRDDPLYYTAKGRVFDVNPVAKLNAPWLRDQNDSAAAVPPEAYSEVDLPDLYPIGMLAGPNAQIVDVQEPFTPHADPQLPLDFDRSEPQFEEVNAYFQIDRAQRYLQSLGYTGPRLLVAYSIPIDPHAANGTDNSYYLEGTVPGRGTLYFGDGGTDDAEDSDIVLHEFMHAIHDWIIPGGLTGSSSSQARAISEGMSDYWSFSSTYAATSASGRDPFCIGDWDARCGEDDPSQQCGYPVGADCLRRVDSTKTIADFVKSETAGTEHVNGAIWSSALREIFMALTQRHGVDAGKRATDTLVLESLFGLPPGPDFATVTRAMISADRLLRGGADVDVICAAMTARGILSASDCGNDPRGEWTLQQSLEQGLVIPDGSGSVVSTVTVGDSRAIDRLAVRVDIAHHSRGDLVITLIAPNGTEVRLKESSQVDRTPDVHATFGIDAAPVDSLDVLKGQPAKGVWQLVVSDVFAGDAGVLESWSLEIVFTGDAAAVIRPVESASRFFVPAVAHVSGASGAQYRSDVYLCDRGSRDAIVTAIFTPSGSDGTTSFSALRIRLAAGQTVVLGDIVRSGFASTGIGSLELRSDSSDVVATSIAATATPEGGGVAQNVDAVPSASAAGSSDPPLFVLPVVTTPSSRTNVGFVETSGAAGVVRIIVRRPGGEIVSTSEVPIAPFGHEQLPILSGDPWCMAQIGVVSGAARIIGYESSIDGRSGDGTFVPARPLSTAATTLTLTAVGHVEGAVGKTWDTELWYATPAVGAGGAARFTYRPAARSGDATETILPPLHTDAVVPEMFRMTGNTSGQLDVDLPAGALVSARTYTASGNGGRAGDRVFAVRSGAAELDALHIESSASLRTNIGVTALDEVPTAVRVTLLDASGRQLAVSDRLLQPRGSIQIGIRSLYAGTVTGGRVRFEATGGRIAAYASVVDNLTQDSVIVEAR